MKSTAKQENNSNFEKYSSSPLICSDPSPGVCNINWWRCGAPLAGGMRGTSCRKNKGHVLLEE